MVLEIRTLIASERRVLTGKEHEETFRGDRSALFLDLGGDYMVYIFVKTCWTVQLIWVFYCMQITVDPWTTWLWTMRVHLQQSFFNSKYYNTSWSVAGWICWRRRGGYRGTTIYSDFLLSGSLAPLTPALFKGQLYTSVQRKDNVYFSNDQFWGFLGCSAHLCSGKRDSLWRVDSGCHTPPFDPRYWGAANCSASSRRTSRHYARWAPRLLCQLTWLQKRKGAATWIMTL